VQVELVRWADVYRRCRQVAAEILKSDFRPDILVAIARGGFVPARILCDFLDVYDLASIKVAHYKAGARKAGSARVVFPLNADIARRRVLLVDDVNDTGDTLRVALPYLQEQSPSELKVAVLDQKAQSGFRVEYFGRLVRRWHWITYPWAVIEDLSDFVKKLDPAPASPEAARQALHDAYAMRPDDATLRYVAERCGLWEGE
jgi:uncharacterized protein